MRRFLPVAITTVATASIGGLAVGKPTNQPGGFATTVKPLP